MKEKDQKLLERAKKNLKRAISAEEHNRLEAIDDLKFRNGEQWPAADIKDRKDNNRSILVYNMLPKFINQVVGDQRQNRPRIKIRPESSDSDVHVAKILEGTVRNIEYQSKAEIIYDQSFESTVSCGYGAWRILTRFKERSFDKEIYIAPLPNPFAVYLDPEAKDPTGADAKWGLILEKMSHEDFKEKYPKAKDPGELFKNAQGTTDEHWYDKDSVTVAEYFEKDFEKKKLALLSDGRVLDYDEAEKAVAGDISLTLTIVKDREEEVAKIKHYLLTSEEILTKPEDWPGKYIPIIILKGQELNIEGKTYVRGLIRFAKDPQRMLNYWKTTEAETLALAPKAPYIATPEQVKGYEDDWENANRKNLGVLRYNPDPLAPGKPQRTQPASPPVAILSAIEMNMLALENIMGMYKASLGAPSNEKSGKAIIARQRESDVGNFSFVDNLKRAIEHTGRIIVDLIPKIHDTEQTLRLKNIDDTENFVPVNTTAGKAFDMISTEPERFQGTDLKRIQTHIAKHGGGSLFNNLDSGTYGVIVDTGPSYTTQRLESVDNMIRLLDAVPQVGQVGDDLIVKNMDFLDAEELADRLRKSKPPGVVKPKEGEQPTPPPPPSPEMMVEMKKAELEEKKLMVEMEGLKVEMMKIEKEMMKIEKEQQNTDDHIKQVVLSVLNEVHAPVHPADGMMMG